MKRGFHTSGVDTVIFWKLPISRLFPLSHDAQSGDFGLKVDFSLTCLCNMACLRVRAAKRWNSTATMHPDRPAMTLSIVEESLWVAASVSR